MKFNENQQFDTIFMKSKIINCEFLVIPKKLRYVFLVIIYNEKSKNKLFA